MTEQMLRRTLDNKISILSLCKILTLILQEVTLFFGVKHLNIKNMYRLIGPKQEIARIHYEGNGFISKGSIMSSETV